MASCGLLHCGKARTFSGMSVRKVRVLINRKSGVGWSLDHLLRAFDAHWEKPGCEISYQFTQSKEDALFKTRSAIDEGVDTLLVAGGDGTVNSVGEQLIGTPVTLGVIPLGSGNGFARHFDIPLNPASAVEALAAAQERDIDVGFVGTSPFLVSCSMAWDAAIVRTFEKSPVRGVLPYVFSGFVEFFEYKPQAAVIELDGDEVIELAQPMIITCANLSQYGGGAVIAPEASADDGMLDLVWAEKEHMPMIIANLGNLLNGSVSGLPHVQYRRFKKMQVRRKDPAPIQLDGELVEWGNTVEVEVRERALRVLVP